MWVRKRKRAVTRTRMGVSISGSQGLNVMG